jgi:hypothetical protein
MTEGCLRQMLAWADPQPSMAMHTAGVLVFSFKFPRPRPKNDMGTACFVRFGMTPKL